MEVNDEKVFQNYVISNLQEWGLDIFRNSNSASKGFSAVHSTTAFIGKIKETKIFQKTGKDKFSCNKYFPDLMFCCDKKVWMVEFGIMVGDNPRNNERKEMQAVRLEHWERVGGVWTYFVYSLEDADFLLKTISRHILKPIKIGYDGKKLK